MDADETAVEGPPAFTFKDMLASEVDEVVQFLDKNFFPREPVSTGLHLGSEDTKGWLPGLTLRWQQSGMSVVAREAGTGVLAGVALGTVLKKGSGQSYDLVKNCTSKNARAVFALVTQVGSDVDAFERFSVDEMLEVEYLSVAQQFEGQGLGSRLAEEVERRGVALGLRVSAVQASHVVSQGIFGRLGYSTIHKLAYADFIFEGTKVVDLDNIGGTPTIDMMEPEQRCFQNERRTTLNERQAISRFYGSRSVHALSGRDQ